MLSAYFALLSSPVPNSRTFQNHTARLGGRFVEEETPAHDRSEDRRIALDVAALQRLEIELPTGFQILGGQHVIVERPLVVVCVLCQRLYSEQIPGELEHVVLVAVFGIATAQVV